MTKIKVKCSECGQNYRVDQAYLGKRATCKKCGGKFVLSSIGEASTPSAKIKVKCSGCGREYRVDEAYLGKIGTCKKCGSKFVLSQPQETQQAIEHRVGTEWRAGDVILDLYEVKELLGEGGMGKVYKVYHRGRNMDMAVKSPKPDVLARVGGAENFEREAETWFNLGLHPHIVCCYYVRRVGDVPRIFCEYVERGSLEDWIRNCKLYEGDADQALKRMLDVAIQFAWGLHFAHEKGLIHQDVKPANVMMTPDGTAKVTDFGLAQARLVVAGADTQGTMMVDGVGMMTLAYASPEQASGQPLTRRTDVWSWGVSVLEMFTAEVAAGAGIAAADRLERYLSSSAKDEQVPHMPVSVAELLRRCFQEDPNARPLDMQEAARTLRGIYGKSYSRQEIVEQFRLEADGLNNQGVSYWELGEYEKARERFEMAVAKENLHPQANWNLGNLMVLTQSLVHPEWGDTTIIMLRNILQENELSDEQGDERIQLTLSNGNFLDAVAKPLVGHRYSVSCTAFSPDGRFVVSGGNDNRVIFWDAKDGRLVKTLEAHSDDVVSLKFSPDGRFFVSGTHDGIATLHELKGTLEFETLGKFPCTPYALAFSPDGSLLSLGSKNGIAFFLDLENKGLETSVERRFGTVSKVAFSPDGSLVATAHYAEVKLWDMERDHFIKRLDGPTNSVYALAFSPDGRYLAAGGADKTVVLWDAKTGQIVNTLKGHRDTVTSLSFFFDSRFLATGSYDKTIRLWDVRTSKVVKKLEAHTKHVNSVTFRGQLLASGSTDGTVRVWVNVLRPQLASLQDFPTLKQAKTKKSQRLSHLADLISQRKYGEAYKRLIAAWGQEGFGKESDLYPFFKKLRAKGRVTGVNFVTPVHRIEAHDDWVTSVVFSPDSQIFATSSHDRDKTIKLWEVENGQLVKKLEGHNSWATSVAFSPDGQFLASGSADKTVKLWQVENGQLVNTLKNHHEIVESVAFSPNGQLFASASDDKTINLYETNDFRLLKVLKGHRYQVYTIAFSPDGRLLASGSQDKTIRFWEVESGNLDRIVDAQLTPLKHIAFSPDGQVFASASDSKLRLWDVASGRLLKTMEGHKDQVTSVSFSSDGRFIASGSFDATIRLWQVKNGNLIETLEGYKSPFYTVSISTDGLFLASGGSDRTVTLWLIIPELEFY